MKKFGYEPGAIIHMHDWEYWQHVQAAYYASRNMAELLPETYVCATMQVQKHMRAMELLAYATL